MSGRVVVGVDASEESKAALRWAVEEARLRGADVVALHVWTYPPLDGPGVAPPAFVIPFDELQREAEELVDAVVSEVVSDEGDVTVRPVAVEGLPSQALLSSCDADDLLVLGSRGHGGFAGLLLGSVGQQCAHHAPCPVVLIRRGGS